MSRVWCLMIVAISVFITASTASATMNGSVDGFTFDGSGDPIANGWACVIGSPTPITVKVYVGQAAPSGEYVGTFNANQSSEPAVATSCQSTGTTYRYKINLAGYTAGSPIYVYSISPADGSTLLLANSGNEYIPPPKPTGGDSVAYQYDGNGRIHTVTYANGTEITYTYDAAGNRQSVVTSCAGSGC